MKELTNQEMLDIDGGSWNRDDVIGAATAALGGGAKGLAIEVARHYIHEAYERVSHDFHAEQHMRHEHDHDNEHRHNN